MNEEITDKEILDWLERTPSNVNISIEFGPPVTFETWGNEGPIYSKSGATLREAIAAVIVEDREWRSASGLRAGAGGERGVENVSEPTADEMIDWLETHIAVIEFQLETRWTVTVQGWTIGGKRYQHSGRSWRDAVAGAMLDTAQLTGYAIRPSADEEGVTG